MDIFRLSLWLKIKNGMWPNLSFGKPTAKQITYIYIFYLFRDTFIHTQSESSSRHKLIDKIIQEQTE